jgi:hypothetical protein
MKIKLPFLLILSLPAWLFLMEGCSGRSKMPVMEPDSTMVYIPKDADGIKAKISLCRYAYKKTGKRIGAGTVFTIGENENVLAFIDLENCFLSNKRDLMFHLDWIDENGKSVYLKQIDLSPLDSTTSINSSISVSPDKRQPGKYKLRVYLFRELIAEKKFELRWQSEDDLSDEDRISAAITFCKGRDKKTGERVGVDSVFTVREKEKIIAFADLKIPDKSGHEDLIFNFEWIDSTGKAFYQKEIYLTTADSGSIINSSVSIAPDARQPGNYVLQLYLYNDLIAEKKFSLKPESQIVKSITESIRAKVTLCRKLDKKTGERIGVDSVFIIRDKQSVRAVAEVEKNILMKGHELIFNFEWMDANGKSFYHKEVVIKPGESFSALNSSISIAPGKRQPGKYIVQLSVFNEVIAEQRFELRAKSPSDSSDKD